MKIEYLVLLVAASGILSVNTARADITQIILSENASQVGQTAFASVSVTATASSDKVGQFSLTVGVGWTMTCEGGLGDTKSVDASTFTTTSGQSKSVTSDNGGTFLVPGYPAWENGSTHQCTVAEKGRAAEGTTGTSGDGYGFTFQVGSLVQAVTTGTESFEMVRGVGGGGCD